MQPADRGLHWQRAAIERERLFDQLDAYLAGAAAEARRARTRLDEDASDRCPECGNPCLGWYNRYGPGGVACCPNCGWEEPPS